MSNSGGHEQAGEPPADGRPAVDHLDDVDDGCGCAEIWEHLSEHRSSD